MPKHKSSTAQIKSLKETISFLTNCIFKSRAKGEGGGGYYTQELYKLVFSSSHKLT